MNEADDDLMPDLTDFDPSLEEMDEIKGRAVEWENVHRELKHEGKQVLFSYRRNVYDSDDPTQDIIVVCECGESELVGYGEMMIDDDDEPFMAWFPCREEPN